MKKILLLVIAITFIYGCKSSSSIFELTPASSMSITGKGPGQDAAFNPYGAGKSLAVVKNLGKNPFSVRVEDDGLVVEIKTVEPQQEVIIPLLENNELYLDADLEGTAQIVFQKAE